MAPPNKYLRPDYDWDISMDDLFIKMIANTKKLRQAQDGDARSLSSSQEARLFQILLSAVMASPAALERFEELAVHLSKRIPEVVAEFAPLPHEADKKMA